MNYIDTTTEPFGAKSDSTMFSLAHHSATLLQLWILVVVLIHLHPAVI